MAWLLHPALCTPQVPVNQFENKAPLAWRRRASLLLPKTPGRKTERDPAEEVKEFRHRHFGYLADLMWKAGLLPALRSQV